MKLQLDDFQLLDFVQTKEGSILTVGLKNDDHFITPKEAFKAYKEGKIISKTVEIDGEPVFENLKEKIINTRKLLIIAIKRQYKVNGNNFILSFLICIRKMRSYFRSIY